MAERLAPVTSLDNYRERRNAPRQLATFKIDDILETLDDFGEMRFALMLHESCEQMRSEGMAADEIRTFAEEELKKYRPLVFATLQLKRV